MKITDIKQQQKRPDRYSVYIDGSFAFGLSEGDLIIYRLRLGHELTPNEVKNLKNASQTGKAYDRALNYISLRPRSEHEIQTYLKRKDYEESTIQDVISRLKKLQLLDDADFARRWVEWRQNTSPRSRRRLWAELTQKGIAQEITEEVLAALDEDEQLGVVKALIAKKAARYTDRQKLIAYLARQGFSYDLIKQALDD